MLYKAITVKYHRKTGRLSAKMQGYKQAYYPCAGGSETTLKLAFADAARQYAEKHGWMKESLLSKVHLQGGQLKDDTFVFVMFWAE